MRRSGEGRISYWSSLCGGGTMSAEVRTDVASRKRDCSSDDIMDVVSWSDSSATGYTMWRLSWSSSLDVLCFFSFRSVCFA